MRSKLVAQLLADLGVTKTHSRPHVSNDNPFSEAGFKTLKYRPDFPERFGCIEDARAYCIVRGAPKPPALPTEVWINKPKVVAPDQPANAPLN